MIYIDPPYNTANGDFIYNDTRTYDLDKLVKMGISEDEAKRVLEFSTRNSSSHSAWLSFMYPRLSLARKLLKDDGVIFISIDDNEAAQLKLLCDEIFGEENFIETFLWNKTQTPPSASYKTRKTHEYILCYQKIKNNSKFVSRITSGGDAPLWNETNSERILTFPANYVVTTLKDGLYKKGLKDNIELLDDVLVKNQKICNEFRLRGHFRWKQDSLNDEIRNNVYLIIKSEKFSIRYCRDGDRIVLPTNEISKKDNVGTNENASEELKTIFSNTKLFSFNKPVSLIKYLVSLCCNLKQDDIVLDFFAGSGTTGHAVMQLNAEDGGNRKFILVQLDEKIDEKKSKIAYDFVKNELKCEPTIYEITKERLLRAAKKISHDYANANNLDFSEYEIVAKDEKELEKLEKLELSLSDNLFSDFDINKINEILTSYKLADGIALDAAFKIIAFNEYKAYYLNKNLYLVYPNFNAECTKLLMQNLQNKDLICERVILYNASFTSSEHKTLKDALNQIGIKLQVRF